MTAVEIDAIVVLAAGEGTRMRSATPKVLHSIGGRSLLGHVLAACADAAAREVVVVVGHRREQVVRQVADSLAIARTAVQAEQLGTGHATQVGLEQVAATHGVVVVVMGDTPLLRGEDLLELAAEHATSKRAVTVLAAQPADPSGYGRMARDDSGALLEVVEEADATPEQRTIREVNTGIYAFDLTYLRSALPRLATDNAQGELYLTDVIGLARADGQQVGMAVMRDPVDTEGVNDRVALAALGAVLNARTLDRWMRAGVTVVDPTTTWVDVTVSLGRDVTIRPGVQLHGATTVGDGAAIGPDSTLDDVQVAAGASVVRSHASGAVIGVDAAVGPFAYLRPGTVVHPGAKVGAFVETKNAEIGPGAKVPHLSYVGDAEIGEGSNIGAGTITANYDGVSKHRTIVGRHCKTGAENVFVAPVTIGVGAVSGAGTVVRRDVPPGALAVSGGPQRHHDGWTARRRPGSAAAAAASDKAGDVGQTDAATSDTPSDERAPEASDQPEEGTQS